MRAILDTSLFFIDYPLSGDLFTTPAVGSELIDLRSRGRYEALLARGLSVTEPSDENRNRVRDAARLVGDAEKLSLTDTDLLALALEISGTLLSDDFAVHNVAAALSIPVQPVLQKKARKRIWKFRCSGCGRFSREPGECRICGSPIKRPIK